MTSKAITALMLCLLIAALTSAGLAMYYRGNAIDYKAQRDTAIINLKLANDTINDMQTRQRDVAALDVKYTKELSIAKAENDALQRKLDRGGRVLVAGSCPKQATQPASVDDGTTVQLSPVAGRNVLSIRAGIKGDRAKIAALQQFIVEQCLK
ncbi:lysis protein [Pantoea sp. Mb-10]|uniref:lysis protein n=1 Tax=unclassified Pantoea TaxID=2630326 RepID=UPI001E39941B|nr:MULTISPECIES: lysis protein [unclassified Pantoea]MCE0490978.1 lysis protein [Pantoea sp. Mb-10]MCE0499864.1 lysis protein [Pantoea sp. Pb-8]